MMLGRGNFSTGIVIWVTGLYLYLMRLAYFYILLVAIGLGSANAQDNSVKKPYSLQRLADYLAVDPFGFKPKLINEGLLVAYTETEQFNDGQIYYYPHTGYRILDMNGNLLKKVPNRVSRHDENPTAVRLPPGHYLLETPWKKALVEMKAGYLTTARLYSQKLNQEK